MIKLDLVYILNRAAAEIDYDFLKLKKNTPLSFVGNISKSSAPTLTVFLIKWFGKFTRPNITNRINKIEFLAFSKSQV